MTDFASLGLIDPLCRAVADEGYTTPTPVQAAAIPHLVKGRDLLGIAQTGTGKTAAFTLPILQHLAQNEIRRQARSVRALVLVPTRELAVQVRDSFAAYGKHVRLKSLAIFGGVGINPQIAALAGGVDALVATPGRLLDLMAQRHVRLDAVEILVLDEADRMLDMGFVRDVRKIVAQLPKQRQTLLFSATMPAAVTSLAEDLLAEYERVEVTPPATTVDRIAQRVLFVDRADKRRLLESLLADKAVGRAIVFTRTKHGANRLAEQLQKAGFGADAIHGNKSQGARQRALDEFRTGRLRALVATDIAARGIDVDGVTHVVNFELPNEPESYVHRIGRTARAGSEGVALSLCDAEELPYLKAIEKTIRRSVDIDDGHAFHAADIAGRHASANGPRPQGPRPQGKRPARQGQRGARTK